MDVRGLKQLSVLKQISFKVKSDLKELDQILYHFDQLDQPWIPRQDWLQCQLALTEGFTNAVRHAHKNLSREIPIEIDILLNQESLEIRIWDYGQAFDLEGFLQKIVQRDNVLAGHGQGLPILEKISSKLSYHRTKDNRNCLLIIKKFFSL